MKNVFKVKAIKRITGFIALVAVIGFSMAACGGNGGGTVPVPPPPPPAAVSLNSVSANGSSS